MGGSAQIKPRTSQTPVSQGRVLGALRTGFSWIGTIGEKVLWTATMAGVSGLLCYVSDAVVHSPFGVVGSMFYSEMVKATAKLLAKTIPSLVPFAPWVMLGVPALIFSYPLIDAALNNRLGNATGLKEFAQNATTLALPIAISSMGIYFGLSSLGGAMIGAGIGAANYVYWAYVDPMLEGLKEERKRKEQQKQQAQQNPSQDTPAQLRVNLQPENHSPESQSELAPTSATLDSSSAPLQIEGPSSPRGQKRQTLAYSSSDTDSSDKESSTATSESECSEDEVSLHRKPGKRKAPLAHAYELSKKRRGEELKAKTQAKTTKGATKTKARSAEHLTTKKQPAKKKSRQVL